MAGMGENISIEALERRNRSAVRVAQRTHVRHEVLKLPSQWTMEVFVHRGTGNAIPRSR
jgi:hypothetical protein